MDLHFITRGAWVTFIPSTPAGESAYRQMAEALGGYACIAKQHLPSTLHQLRAAGYTVARAQRTGNGINARDGELLAALGF